MANKKSIRAELIPHRVYQQRPKATKDLWGEKPTAKKVGRKRGKNGIDRQAYSKDNRVS